MTAPSVRPVPTASVRLDALTGVRILAALWVTLLHLRAVAPGRTYQYPLIDPFIVHGGYGVELFFVLSGFILCHVYLSRFAGGVTPSRLKAFLTYRFARLYPLQIVTFVLMYALFTAQRVLTGTSTAPADRYDWQSVVTSLTMTHAWFPGVETPNLPAWSISAEWFAYLLFPVLCTLIVRRKHTFVLFAAVGLGLSVLNDFVYYDLTRVMAGFLIGMALYRLVQQIGQRVERFRFVGAVAALLIVVWVVVLDGRVTAIGLLLFALLIGALSNERDWLARPLGTRAMVYLGEVSYALYMFHWVARVMVRAVLERLGLIDRLPDPAIVLIYLAVAVVGAIALHHLVERPGRTAIRHLVDRLPRRAALPDAPTTP